MAALVDPESDALTIAGPPAPRPAMRLELAANLAGAGWGAFVQLVCIPLYVRVLGIEAYGLVAFSSTVFLALKALDLGASYAMNRELARAGERAADAHAFALGLERAYLALGALIGVALFLLAPLIATRWISAGAIPTAQVIRAARWIALFVAVQWPLTLYQGGLMGRRRTVAMNVVAIVAATCMGLGGVLLVVLVRPSLELLLGWMTVVAAAHSLAAGWLHHRALPGGDAPVRGAIRPLEAALVTLGQTGGLTLTALLLAQADKLAASRWLPLSGYGAYMIGAAVASGIAVLSAPVFNTVFPRLTALAAVGERRALRETYSLATQTLAALAFPAAATIALLARDLLRLWTRDAATAALATGATAGLVIGTALYGVLQLPQALQMAVGRPRRGIMLNVLATVLLPAGALLLAPRWGAAGVAFAWAGLLLLHLVATAVLVHEPLVGGGARWLVGDVGGPLAAVALGALVLSRVPVVTAPLPTFAMLLRLGAVGLVLTLLALAAAPRVRRQAFGGLTRVRR